LIRTWAATDASRDDGAQLENLIDKRDTASDVWADTAYRSAKNEALLEDSGLRSQIHRKKPKGKPMPEAIAKANGKKSKVRAFIEHVFARQKGAYGPRHPNHRHGQGQGDPALGLRRILPVVQ
jgi:transposase, IS5 family